MVRGLRQSGREKFGADLIALPGEGEIFFGESAFIMRGEFQCHPVETDVDIRMVIDFLGFPGDPIDKIHAFQESRKLEGPTNGSRAFRPVWNGF